NSLGLVSIDLVIEPEHLPRFVCVITADPPECPKGETCAVTIGQIHKDRSPIKGEVNVAPEVQWGDLRLQDGSALKEALHILAQPQGLQACQDDAACPISIATADTGRYLSCAARPETSGSLVAILDLGGTLSAIVGMKFEESHVYVNTM